MDVVGFVMLEGRYWAEVWISNQLRETGDSVMVLTLAVPVSRETEHDHWFVGCGVKA